MKYRATCPHCGIRFSRRVGVLNLPHVRRKCSACGNSFRAVAWSEYLGNGIIIVAGLLPIFLLSLIGQAMAIALTIAVVGLAIYAWPYVTVFEKLPTRAGDDA